MNVLDIVFPKRCLGCGKVGKYFCSQCQLSIRTIDQNKTTCPVCEKPAIDGITHPRCKTRYTLDGLTSFFYYRGVVQKAVKALKYRFISDLAEEFVSLIPSSCLLFLHRKSYIVNLVPIPLHPSRERFRGFNQAEVVGKFIAQRAHIPYRSDLMKRVVKTMSQVEVKDREKRMKNMEKAFQVSGTEIKGSSILLFDDVWTTGSTMRSAGSTLKRAGASSVWGVTMAR